MGRNIRVVKNTNKDEYFFDYSLLFVVLFLLGFGLVMVYSASSYDASTSKSFNYDAAYFLKKQAFARGESGGRRREVKETKTHKLLAAK